MFKNYTCYTFFFS